jgi:hypothetical protein
MRSALRRSRSGTGNGNRRITGHRAIILPARSHVEEESMMSDRQVRRLDIPPHDPGESALGVELTGADARDTGLPWQSRVTSQ